MEIFLGEGLLGMAFDVLPVEVESTIELSRQQVFRVHPAAAPLVRLGIHWQESKCKQKIMPKSQLVQAKLEYSN